MNDFEIATERGLVVFAVLLCSRSAIVPDSILYVAWASCFIAKSGFPIAAKTGYTESDSSLF